MSSDPRRTAVVAMHWQVNVIEPEGFFGALLSEPVARAGVVARAARFHTDAVNAGAALFYTRFTIPEGEGTLVRNTGFMRAVGDAQEAFRPDAPGSALVEPMHGTLESAEIVDNQKLCGFVGNDLPDRLASRGIDTVLLTGVATNLTVEQTARHGTDLGFVVHVIADCVTAADETAHTASLANLELTTAGSLTTSEALSLLC